MVSIFNMIHREMTGTTQFFEGKPFELHLPAVISKVEKQSDDDSPRRGAVDRMEIGENYQYCVTVKKYMTEPASSAFNFMAQWNDNIPMPLRVMTGYADKETRGMVHVTLHGQAEKTVTCMRCGRTLTNEVSMLYGIGPECIHHVPFIMDIDINDVDAIKNKLVDVTWTGWIIKSAITNLERIS